MTLWKNLNGVNVQLSEAEEREIRSEWEANAGAPSLPVEHQGGVIEYAPTVSVGDGEAAESRAVGAYFDVGALRFFDVEITIPEGVARRKSLSVSLPTPAVADFSNARGYIEAHGRPCFGFGRRGSSVLTISLEDNGEVVLASQKVVTINIQGFYRP